MDSVRPATIAEARRAGLDIRAEADHLIIRGPRSLDALARRLLAEKPRVLELLASEELEIAGRIEAMRRKTSIRGPVPLLTARDAPPQPGACLSCGATLDPNDGFRCDLCVRAARIVLNS